MAHMVMDSIKLARLPHGDVIPLLTKYMIGTPSDDLTQVLLSMGGNVLAYSVASFRYLSLDGTLLIGLSNMSDECTFSVYTSKSALKSPFPSSSTFLKVLIGALKGIVTACGL